MIYIYIKDGVDCKIKWTILKGQSAMPEDFQGANLSVWLKSHDDKFVANYVISEDNSLLIDVPVDMPAGVYSLKAVWEKDRHGKVSMAEVSAVFAVANKKEDATVDKNPLIIKIQSNVATYGYDGLSAYELACLYGKNTMKLKESLWVANLAEMNAKNEEMLIAEGSDDPSSPIYAEGRKANERQRQANEVSRIEEEANRNNNENDRLEFEYIRQLDEMDRHKAEEEREANEETRKSNEAARQTEEAKRVRAEENREEQEGMPEDAPHEQGSRWSRYKYAEGEPNDAPDEDGSRWARFQNEQSERADEFARAQSERYETFAHNENERIYAELLRKDAEGYVTYDNVTGEVTGGRGRKYEEALRVQAEGYDKYDPATHTYKAMGRKAAEERREIAEELRDETENERIEAEKQRKLAEETRQHTFEQSEAQRDVVFQSKEQTRDAANQAALNAAGTLAEHGEKLSELDLEISNILTWDELLEHDGWIAGEQYQLGSGTHKVLKVAGNKICKITAKGTNNTFIYVVKSYEVPYESSLSPNYASGYSDRIRISNGTAVSINIPDDAKYIVVTNTYKLNGETFDRSPLSIDIDGVSVMKGIVVPVSEVISNAATNTAEIKAVKNDIYTEFINVLNPLECQEDKNIAYVDGNYDISQTVNDPNNFALSGIINVEEGSKYIINSMYGNDTIFVAPADNAQAIKLPVEKNVPFEIPHGYTRLRYHFPKSNWRGKVMLIKGNTMPTSYVDYGDGYNGIKFPSKDDFDVVKSDVAELQEAVFSDKACIVLNFDGTEDGAFFAERKALLDSYGFKASAVISHKSVINDFSEWRSAEDEALYKQLIRDGYDVGLYVRVSAEAKTEQEWKTFLSNANSNLANLGIYNITGYHCTGNMLNEALYNALVENNFRIIRCSSGQYKAPSSTIWKYENNTKVIVSATYSIGVGVNINDVKSVIDTLCTNGGYLNLMTHLVQDVDPSQIESYNISKNEYVQILDYIKTKVDSGMLNVITWRQMYNSISRDYGYDNDYNRLIKMISL